MLGIIYSGMQLRVTGGQVSAFSASRREKSRGKVHQQSDITHAELQEFLCTKQQTGGKPATIESFPI